MRIWGGGLHENSVYYIVSFPVNLKLNSKLFYNHNTSGEVDIMSTYFTWACFSVGVKHRSISHVMTINALK